MSKKEELKPDSANQNPIPDEYIDYRDLKIGDYELHIYLEETRGLVHPTDSSSTVDPIVKLAAFGEHKSTKYKSNRGTGMIYWGEHVFFNKKINDGLEFQLEKLLIQIYDYNLIGSNALIGQFEIDLASIYFAEQHSILHKWVALSNYKNKFDEIKGFLKFSANIVATGDKQIELSDEKPSSDSQVGFFKDSGKGNINVSNVLLPPQIQTKGWQMKISLMRAENLIQMDWGGSIDSYLLFQFGNAQFVTEIIKDTKNPVWAKKILLPFSEPSINEFLVVKVFDWDRASKDEIVGSASFKKSDIVDGKKKNFFWLNIYGAQKDGDEKNSKIMNSNPELGTFWKGRVLLSIEAHPEENPKVDCEPLESKIADQYSMSKSKPMEWMIIAELFYGMSFPKKDEKYSIQIRWADVELTFEKIKSTNNIWEWYQRKNQMANFPYISTDELPDVLIYVLYGDKRISYVRYKASYFMYQLENTPQIIYFKPDRSISPNLRDDECGIAKLRVTVGMKQGFSDLSKGGWDRPINKPVQQIGFLFAHIYHAQDLIPADNDGTSDPYCMISYCGVEKKTEVIDDSLNPIWNKSYELQVPVIRVEDSPPIILKIFDEDVTSDDFVGSVFVYLDQGVKEGYITINQQNLPKPKWLPLKLNKNSNCGRILASFSFFTSKPLNYYPRLISNLTKYYVKMKILGLRNLKSLGIFPVKRPIIKFDLNSLRSKEQRQDLQEKKHIVTQPNYYGSNPNISTIINFELFLPDDVSLWPFMNCIVYDSILKGIIQPVLGTFSINLADIENKTKQRLDKKFKKIGSVFMKNNLIGNAFKGIANPNKNNEIPSKKENQVLDISNLRKSNKENYQILNEEKDASRISEMSMIKAPVFGKVITEEGIFSEFIVKKAEYRTDPSKKIPGEINIPDPTCYIGLGYDAKDKRLDSSKIQKHYRYFLDTELENSPFMDKFTFDEYSITRGSRIKSDSVFMEMLGFEESEKTVGKFKGWIDIISENDKKKIEGSKAGILARNYLENRQITGAEIKNKKKVDIDKEFIDKTQIIVRVYVLTGSSLPQMDDDSLSDPFIEVILGNEKKNNKENYLKDVTNADFYTMFELKGSLPGNSQLEIKVWDYDFLVKDDLIGQTTIDLENRFFSKKWRKLDYIPIETRELFNPLSSINRGRLRLWVEMIPVHEVALLKQIWNIKPKPSSEFELRVVVWECSDIPSSDIEDTSDIYVTGRVGEKLLKTDVHYRSQNGEGSFNWRMVFPVTLPLKDNTINFQIYDKDILSPDDFVADTTIDFKDFADDAFENDCVVKMFANGSLNLKKEALNAIENIIPTEKKNSGGEGKIKSEEKEKVLISLKNAKKEGYSVLSDVGKLIISFELVPGDMAKNNPVGQGRSDPNNSPWLPPPVNRFEWSWNPLTLFNRCIGPKARAKVCICLCIVLCCVIMIMIFPSVFGVIFGNFISGK